MLLTGSIGSGHTRAAEAVADAMHHAHAASVARVIDVLAHSAAPFRAIYRDLYISLIERAPTAIGWLYRSSDRTTGGALRRSIQRSALSSLRHLIANEKPDTIVCTHFLAAEVVSGMVARREWIGTFAVVVTDLDAHSMWAMCPNADRWYVALDETREILAAKGIAHDRIVVTGIPISGSFSARLPCREAIKERFGLPKSPPMILVSGGGVGVARLAETVRELLDMPVSCSLVLVCGRNAKLQAEAARVLTVRPADRERCRILGFTDRMHELMHAADLAIGKPGGLTSSEALACALPMGIVHPVPGQEERNSDHLLEWGVAIRLNSPESLQWRVAGLLSDRERLMRMQSAARARAKPYAADEIVEDLRKLRDPEPLPPPAPIPIASMRTTRAERMQAQ
ncbi:MAG: hypothetical protein RL136_1379 [Planctomycetota bacterium]|jgi:processive 1,2-diacylglycerol beta-glucosyltransferase